MPPECNMGWLASGQSHAVYVPGSTSTNGEGINDLGTLVGSFTDAAGATHAFGKRRDTFTQFDFPGGHDTVPVAINNRDEIVGLFTDVARPDACLQAEAWRLRPV